MSKTFDVVIRGGKVVTADKVIKADIGIADERIAEIGEKVSGGAREAIDAEGLHVFPGVIDSHVHFNDPGRAHWEGVETGSKACAAGGGTTYFDMPLNSSPPTLDGESFDKKLAATKGRSAIDFAFWGGLTPDSLPHMEGLAAKGVIGFKAFMSNSGIEDFARADEKTLRAGMKIAAKVGKLVGVHAESEELTGKLTQTAVRQGKIGIRDYLESRPIQAELEAIRTAIETAGETGCALHIVHVSSGAAVALVSEARKRGVDVTCETCPHYLVLTEEDVIRLGAVAKCAPPLRGDSVRLELWDRLRNAEIDTIGSDHSPAPPEMKTDPNFFKVWGGISGTQHTLPLLVTEFPYYDLDLPAIARLLSVNVAKRFGIANRKGGTEVGKDADLCLVNPDGTFALEREGLLYRHKQSPYVGRKLKGRVIRTIVRGRTVFVPGVAQDESTGRLVAG